MIYDKKMAGKGKNIGIEVHPVTKSCNDHNCPFHGALRCRGRTFRGTVIGTKMHKTVVVEWETIKAEKKFERFEKKRTRLKAHNPECLSAKEGDGVLISECRPISKTKSFVVIEIEGKDIRFQVKKEALEEGKTRKLEPLEEQHEGTDRKSN